MDKAEVGDDEDGNDVVGLNVHEVLANATSIHTYVNNCSFLYVGCSCS